MPNFRTWLFLLLLGGAIHRAEAAEGKIHKVLVQYLDRQGRHTLAPSLFERDAYQAHLRQYPKERAAMRIDVHWKAKGAASSELKLRVEVRSSTGDPTKPLLLESPVKAPRALSKWTTLTRAGEDFVKMGEVIAWRATLWDGETLLAEQKSFLW